MLPDFTLTKLSDHIMLNDIGNDDFLFAETVGKPLTQDRAQRVFERALLKANITKGPAKKKKRN
jgi:hypothetical protein